MAAVYIRYCRLKNCLCYTYIKVNFTNVIKIHFTDTQVSSNSISPKTKYDFFYELRVTTLHILGNSCICANCTRNPPRHKSQ